MPTWPPSTHQDVQDRLDLTTRALAGFGPTSGGALAWNWDPIVHNVGAMTLATQYVYLVRVDVPITMTVSTLRVIISAGVSATGYFGLYDSSGTRLAQSAAQTTSLSTAGVKAVALTSSATITGAPDVYVYAAFLMIFSSPTFVGSNGANNLAMVGSSSAPPFRLGYYTVTPQSTLPAALTSPATNVVSTGGSGLWVALS